jgi:hypothetical protein
VGEKHNAEGHQCPLCGSQTAFFWVDPRREYWRCFECWSISVPAYYHLDSSAERAEYDLHENSATDLGYRKFLSRIHEPIIQRMPPGNMLDFGCGPVPVLADMFAQSGWSTQYFDKFYYPDTNPLQGRYHVITLTEVAEHLQSPGAELDRLWGLIGSGGILAIMTKRWLSLERFAQWHYKNDLTHICFFHEMTFHWLKDKLNARLEIISADIILLAK